jgi:hypothetical protein
MNLTPDLQETIRIEEKPAPISLPQRVADARRFAHWGKLMFLLVALLFLLAAGWSFMTIFFWHRFPVEVIYYGFGMVVAFLGAYMVQHLVIGAIDQGRFYDARSSTLVWMVLGFITLVLPGLFLLLAFVNLDADVQPTPAPTPIPTAAPAPANSSAQPYVPPSPPPVKTP